MTSALLAKLAVPVILEALKTGLGRIDHPAARGASVAIDELQGAVATGAITPEQLVHVEKMAAVRAEGDSKILESVNASLRAEVASTDPYVRRMRPTFGYMMAVTWGAQMMAIAYVIIAEPREAGNVMNGMADLGTIWAVALSVLGIYVYQRSNEKMTGFEILSPRRRPESRVISSPDPGLRRNDAEGRSEQNKTPGPAYND